jgi:hypothetical protein
MLKISVWPVLFVFFAYPLAAQAKEYFISMGHNFSEGSIANSGVFIGKKLEFYAAFNETNIYTLPGDEQADTNKLFGVSDCGNHHVETSARFGWRWYNNRLEILGVTHKDRLWHLSDVMGVAELGKVYHFEFEISEDQRNYVFRFNHGAPVLMERGCISSSMVGYILPPFFGGSEPSPKDMHLSIWREERANFSVEKFGSNPVFKGDPLHIWLRVPNRLKIDFEVFNIKGQLIHKEESVEFEGSEELQKHSLQLPTSLSSGMYLVRPSIKGEHGPLPGYILGEDGESMKIIFMR